MSILYKYSVQKIITDNGSSFVNKLMDDLTKEYGFTHVKIPPYSPHINIVERANRVMKQMIRAYVNLKQTNWDQYLPEFAYAINSSKQTSTGFSPNLLMFGREVLPASHLRKKLEPSEDVVQECDYPQFVRSQARLEELYELVDRHQLKASAQQANYYDRRHNVTISYQVGDKGWRKNFRQSSAADHYNSKLDRLFVGPYTIVQQVSPVIYVLAKESGVVEGPYHIKDLRRYLDSDNGDLPQTSATGDVVSGEK